MHIHYSSRFRKQYKKLPKKISEKTLERIRIFVYNEFHPTLDNHSLHGPYAGRRSINITGDLRLIYEKYSDGSLNFIAIGAHSQLFR